MCFCALEFFPESAIGDGSKNPRISVKFKKMCLIVKKNLQFHRDDLQQSPGGHHRTKVLSAVRAFHLIFPCLMVPHGGCSLQMKFNIKSK